MHSEQHRHLTLPAVTHQSYRRRNRNSENSTTVQQSRQIVFREAPQPQVVASTPPAAQFRANSLPR